MSGIFGNLFDAIFGAGRDDHTVVTRVDVLPQDCSAERFEAMRAMTPDEIRAHQVQMAPLMRNMTFEERVQHAAEMDRLSPGYTERREALKGKSDE